MPSLHAGNKKKATKPKNIKKKAKSTDSGLNEGNKKSTEKAEEGSNQASSAVKQPETR